MKTIIRIAAGTAAVVLAATTAASAQQEGIAPTSAAQPEAMSRAPNQGGLEAILYSDTLLRGHFHSVRAPTPNLNLPWDARSVRVRSGEWQICSGRNYTGTCRTIDRDQTHLTGSVRRIQSMRPTGGFGTGVGESLRGATAEFFPAPKRFGRRIECNGSSCARSEANAFCRSVGWIVARSQALETVAGRSMVSDVLCARTPF
ncbi:hypothetical protein GCM10023264_12640 [Sphingomonas daechungensis]|uniref:beta/gamma crystallin-related protein n=1 Tax=Sphingomonas daechungensis TaxID=1176646 RepID=UPI0031EE1423